jgi:hypothetical protein
LVEKKVLKKYTCPPVRKTSGNTDAARLFALRTGVKIPLSNLSAPSAFRKRNKRVNNHM